MKKNFSYDIVIGLFFICVFAVCLFFVLASGARVYKDVSGVMEEQYTERTALGYIATKLRQNDVSDAVSIGELAGTPAIVIYQNIDGEDYNTFVYCYNGYISELFCPASESLLPSDGLPVIAADSLEFSRDGSLMRIVCRTSAGSGEIYVNLNSMGGEPT